MLEAKKIFGGFLVIIAIGGPHGSGKSSVAHQLAKKLRMKYVSAGQVFRELAKESRMTLKELSVKAINDESIDIEIDKRTKSLGKIDNTIIDAQLAAFMAPEADLKISITASENLRWKRIASRENCSLEDSKNETLLREKVEQERFLKLYNIDINDTSVYDVIINTDRMPQADVLNLIERLIIYTKTK